MMKRLFLCAGETSGDVLGGKLVEALLKQDPSLHLLGVGGPLMRQAGMEIVHPLERFQVMGFSAVLKALPRLLLDCKKLQKQILALDPAAVIFIDYPDFNMLLAKRLRKNGYRGKLIHYVCPSVWAWRKKRVSRLAKTLDCLLSILPFEKSYFSQTTLPVTYVGHPLVAAIDQYQSDPSFNLLSDRPVLAIFPGSRRQEIALNLPLQWEIAKRFPEFHPAISVARPELREEIYKFVPKETLFVPQERRYELMQKARLALATSGTIVLELGLHSVPTLVTYQLSSLNYLLGRYLFRIHLPFYTLVNIICEQEVFPEFIHKDLSIEKMAAGLQRLDQNREVCQARCKKLRDRLSTQNASYEAAKMIQQFTHECIVKDHIRVNSD